MLILGITAMAALLCTVLLYGCITVGKRNDREYRRLWEEYIAVNQKEEEKENGKIRSNQPTVCRGGKREIS